MENNLEKKIKELEQKVKEARFELRQAMEEYERCQGEKIATDSPFSIGDKVEYVYWWWFDDHNRTLAWDVSTINGFSKTGKDEIIIVKLENGRSQLLSDCKLFDENDYTLRHSTWDGEIELEQKIQLTVEKPNSTKGCLYTVFKIVHEVDQPRRLWFYNDCGVAECVVDDEFHITFGNK